jgi:uncharacterized protein (DUF433 family)
MTPETPNPRADFGPAIQVDPHRHSGFPCLPGTRFPLSRVVAEIADGPSVGELAGQFDLDSAVIQAALRELARWLDRPFASEDRRAATPGPGAIERAAEQDKATIDRLAKALRRTLGELMARCGELPEPIATLLADRAVARILAAELGAGGDAGMGDA